LWFFLLLLIMGDGQLCTPAGKNGVGQLHVVSRGLYVRTATSNLAAHVGQAWFNLAWT
jgi:hypothetical protein